MRKFATKRSYIFRSNVRKNVYKLAAKFDAKNLRKSNFL